MKLLYRLIYRAAVLYWRILHPVTVGVKLLLIQEGQVMLVKHSYQADWFLPGGGVKRNETLEAAARREAAEEVGATLGQLSLFGIYTNFTEGRTDHITVFSCTDLQLSEKVDWEIEKCEFFSLESLPEGISPGTRRRVVEYFTGSQRPEAAVW